MHSLVDKDPRVACLLIACHFFNLLVLNDLLHHPSINSQFYRYQVCKFAFVDLNVHRVGEKEALINIRTLNCKNKIVLNPIMTQ